MPSILSVRHSLAINRPVFKTASTARNAAIGGAAGFAAGVGGVAIGEYLRHRRGNKIPAVSHKPARLGPAPEKMEEPAEEKTAMHPPHDVWQAAMQPKPGPSIASVALPTLAVAGGLFAGRHGANWLASRHRKAKLQKDYDDAQNDYESAVALPTKTALDHLQVLKDYGPGLAVSAATLAAIAGGVGGYHRAASRSSEAMLAKALKHREMLQSLRSPLPVQLTTGEEQPEQQVV
jgi:hypothetical protein